MVNFFIKYNTNLHVKMYQFRLKKTKKLTHFPVKTRLSSTAFPAGKKKRRASFLNSGINDARDERYAGGTSSLRNTTSINIL